MLVSRAAGEGGGEGREEGEWERGSGGEGRGARTNHLETNIKGLLMSGKFLMLCSGRRYLVFKIANEFFTAPFT